MGVLNRGKLLQTGVTEKQKNQLRNFVYLKTNVAEFMWFLLSGFLTTSASYNYIINSACSHSVKDMQEKHAEYQSDIDTETAAENAAPPRRTYTTKE